jgi:protein-L-isoaspartate(D-aspartate) O-methyltransferase
MNYALLRHDMVVQQLERRDIYDPRVLEAMEWVPRDVFVPPDLVELAYEDRALPIGLEQTISQPYTVAFMCQEAGIAAGDKVLEIGTGSGYGAAVLSLLAREVHTIERIEELYREARERLARLGYKNVHVHHCDGTLGLPEEAPFDAIVCTAGAEDLPSAYPEQLAEGGRLLIPIGPPSRQQMVRIMRKDGKLQHEVLGSFGFVPLVSDEP